MNFPILINLTIPFTFEGILGGNFKLYSNFDRTFCKQTVENLIRLRRLIWLCTVCRWFHKRGARLKWVKMCMQEFNCDTLILFWSTLLGREQTHVQTPCNNFLVNEIRCKKGLMSTLTLLYQRPEMFFKQMQGYEWLFMHYHSQGPEGGFWDLQRPNWIASIWRLSYISMIYFCLEDVVNRSIIRWSSH